MLKIRGKLADRVKQNNMKLYYSLSCLRPCLREGKGLWLSHCHRLAVVKQGEGGWDKEKELSEQLMGPLGTTTLPCPVKEKALTSSLAYSMGSHYIRLLQREA